jgi:acetyltransferase-like isoleucine patch superfamily enzyme
LQQGHEKKPVVIGGDVFIASNSFIMPGVTIPDGCIVAAGSVVGVKNYPPYSIIAGNPARVVGSRKK